MAGVMIVAILSMALIYIATLVYRLQATKMELGHKEEILKLETDQYRLSVAKAEAEAVARQRNLEAEQHRLSAAKAQGEQGSSDASPIQLHSEW